MESLSYAPGGAGATKRTVLRAEQGSEAQPPPGRDPSLCASAPREPSEISARAVVSSKLRVEESSSRRLYLSKVLVTNSVAPSRGHILRENYSQVYAATRYPRAGWPRPLRGRGLDSTFRTLSVGARRGRHQHRLVGAAGPNTPRLTESARASSRARGREVRHEPAAASATYRTLLGLLVVRGMRIGEAIWLDRSDFDFDSGCVIVRGGKPGAPRELPLHPSAATSPSDIWLTRDGHYRCPNFAVRGAHAIARRLGAVLLGRTRSRRGFRRGVPRPAYRGRGLLLLR